MQWACENCPKKKFSDLDEYTVKLYHIYLLQKGGYPLEKNDLTLEEWVDVGRIKDALEPKMSCPLMGQK